MGGGIPVPVGHMFRFQFIPLIRFHTFLALYIYEIRLTIYKYIYHTAIVME